MSYFKKFLLIFLVLFFCKINDNSAKNSNQISTVNILTWWGYLNYPEVIASAEKNCGVKISFDEYFSNDEFLRRWEAQKDYYDVIVFSDTIYNIMKYKIPIFKSSTLWHQSYQYNPIIKNHYNKKKYPHNVTYFIHAMTGFLWNSKNITISKNDSIQQIFAKAKDNYIVLMDDPVEVKKLIEAAQSSDSSVNKFTLSNFKKLIQNSKTYITNNYAQIYNKSKFAFSFSWSGAAINDLIKSNKKYEFLIHPKLSYISSDLIAQTSNKKETLCVAKFLSSKATLNSVQNQNYFSPYGDYANVNNENFKKIYIDFIEKLPELVWIDSISDFEFQEINQTWQFIKLSLNNHFIRQGN